MKRQVLPSTPWVLKRRVYKPVTMEWAVAGLQCVSSFTVTVPVHAVTSWPAQSSWFPEKTAALACPLLPAGHSVAVTPSSCLSTSCSNFFACPDIIMRLIIMRLMASHRLSSVPGSLLSLLFSSWLCWRALAKAQPVPRLQELWVCRSSWWQLFRKSSWSLWDCPLRTNPPRFLLAYQQISREHW